LEKAQTSPGPGLGREPDSLFIPGRLEMYSGDRSVTGSTARPGRSCPGRRKVLTVGFPPWDSPREKAVRGDSYPSPYRGHR
jgi:hypothetical protein